MKKHKFKVSEFIPFIITSACAIVTLIIYVCIIDGKKTSDYLAMIATAFIPLAVPLYPFVFKRELPIALGIAFALHIVIAVDLGTAMRVYDLIGWWDLFAHGTFGFICCATAYYVIADCNGVRLKPALLFVLAACVTMAGGALWEIVEYVFDLITGGDTQKVAESIAAGKSPVADTIEDLMITAAGVALFAVTVIIDRLSRNKFFEFIGFNQSKKEPEE